MQISKKNSNLKIKHLKLFLLFLFIFFVVTSYSWIPIVVFSIPLLALLQFNLVSLKILNVVFIIYIILIAMIMLTLNKQIVYIEYARNLLFIPLIISSYFIGNQLAENYMYLKKVFYMFLFSACFLVLYTFIFVIPLDIPLFVGERRGYSAREFLFFGRYYDFSLGVTHLNMYINLVFSLLFVCIIYTKRNYLFFVMAFFVILALLTQSRSPILFLMIISTIFLIYKFKISNNKGTFLTICLILFSCLAVLAAGLVILKVGASSSRFSAEGMSDLSRFIFYAKGIEHLILEPWGNSLLYTDEKMPLLNYHNTFLAIGNRMGVVSMICFLVLFLILIFRINKLKEIKFKASLYILSYFCFHNFMIEDVIKFDSFVVLLFFILVPFVRRYYFIEKRLRLNV